MGAVMRNASAWVLLVATGFASPTFAQEAVSLRPASSFQDIPDQAQRARAILGEMGKVLTHPRCMNCHPAGDQPLQGAEHRVHSPPTGRERPGYFGPCCATCHTDRNFTLHATATFKSIPGHPRWQL